MVFAEFGSGQVLWSMFMFFLLFLWIWLIISIFGDLIRDPDLSGWWKAAWSIFIIFIPFFGVFLYLIVRGGSMSDRAVRDAQQREEAFQEYIRTTASGAGDAGGGQSQAEQLATLADLHGKGSLSDQEYEAAKARVLAG